MFHYISIAHMIDERTVFEIIFAGSPSWRLTGIAHDISGALTARDLNAPRAVLQISTVQAIKRDKFIWTSSFLGCTQTPPSPPFVIMLYFSQP